MTADPQVLVAAADSSSRPHVVLLRDCSNLRCWGCQQGWRLQRRP